MKTACLLSIVLLSMTAAVAAQESSSKNSTIPPVQAPPAMTDPGVKHPAPATSVPDAKQKQDAATTVTNAEHPADSPGLPANVQAAAEVAELPVITVRQQGADTIEEYRKHGKLIFRKVVTKNGPTKLYVDNPGDIPPDIMKQMSGPSGVVQPVYYKLYEWK